MSVRRLSKTFISGAGAAAEKSSSFLANYSPAIDEMDLIERITVGAGGTSAIEFDQIPQTYQHLQLRAVARVNTGSDTGITNFSTRFNDISTSSYSWHQLYGNGSSALANAGWSNQTGIESAIRGTGASALSNAFGVNILDILDYSNTSKNKVTRSVNGGDLNGSGIILLTSGLFMSTSAINKISMTHASGVGQYSTFSLYGVKA